MTRSLRLVIDLKIDDGTLFFASTEEVRGPDGWYTNVSSNTYSHENSASFDFEVIEKTDHIKNLIDSFRQKCNANID